MTLAIITMPSGLTPDKVVGYSLVSVAGALGYIAYSMVSGKLLQLREERQALSVALFATAQYLRARARMYENGVDIDRGYRAMITTQAQMIAAHQGARDAMLGHMSTQSVGKSRARLMLWNVMVDMSALVDLVISTQTDYTLLHQRLQKSPALGFMRGALAGMADELDRLMVAVGSGKPVLALQAPDNHLHRLASELQTLKDSGFALTEPETYAIAAHICQRLTKMQEIVQRMASQPETAISRQTVAKPLQPTFLEQSLSSLMSTQSFSLKLFASNLTLGSAAFRYALRVSLGVALAMVAGMYVPDTGAHGYWIALTVIVIMKPAYSLSQQRNANRLIGTLLGCALVFGLLHITTNSNIFAWGVCCCVPAVFCVFCDEQLPHLQHVRLDHRAAGVACDFAAYREPANRACHRYGDWLTDCLGLQPCAALVGIKIASRTCSQRNQSESKITASHHRCAQTSVTESRTIARD
ncbi:MAG: FUSC family protein [Burkholderiaceae bacterium]|nr:FUSC family protein [Burkholderiaceae bacterium]